MATSNSTMIHKLQRAINSRGFKILINKSQFYSEDQDRPVTIYYVKQAIYDENRKRNNNVELFHSTSEIQIVLFMRDFWFTINDWELPTDNETWNKIREKIQKEQEDG